MGDSITDLEDELTAAKNLSVNELARAIQRIGFECTHCGDCCRAPPDGEHVATIFPKEVRDLKEDEESWDEVAKPMPFGVTETSNQTFEWALQTTECGDCVFYGEKDDNSFCSRYENRPLICQTYPFSIDLTGNEDHRDGIVEKEGNVVAYECEGIGSEISVADAKSLAESIKMRAIREVEESIKVLTAFENRTKSTEEMVVHDSEGAKRPDGTRV